MFQQILSEKAQILIGGFFCSRKKFEFLKKVFLVHISYILQILQLSLSKCSFFQKFFCWMCEWLWVGVVLEECAVGCVDVGGSEMNIPDLLDQRPQEQEV